MVIDNVFGFNSPRKSEVAAPSAFSRILSAIANQLARVWCGMHGHLILLHFEPNKLSLQCGLCGYESEGWEVGRPMTARRQVNNPQARPERRRTLRPLPSNVRLAS
ncbi:MAG TPA: hypothetical protein VJM31_16535 [Vicinamibacterales bacterium]|nr:hypothetical protein [Vicinamibacterales bacterium]